MTPYNHIFMKQFSGNMLVIINWTVNYMEMRHDLESERWEWLRLNASWVFKQNEQCWEKSDIFSISIPLPDINMSKLTLESVLMRNHYKPIWLSLNNQPICSLAKRNATSFLWSPNAHGSNAFITMKCLFYLRHFTLFFSLSRK